MSFTGRCFRFRCGEVSHRIADCGTNGGLRRGRGGGEGTNSFTGRKRRRRGRGDILIRHSSIFVDDDNSKLSSIPCLSIFTKNAVQEFFYSSQNHDHGETEMNIVSVSTQEPRLKVRKVVSNSD